MAVSAQTQEVIDNYKAISVAMFAEDSAYSNAKKEITETFNNFGLVNAEHGQVLAQTLAQLASQGNSEALRAGQTMLTLAEDVELKKAQTKLVLRQERGYDDNQLIKVTEFQSGVTQFAVNAGDANNIQSSVSLLNAKIAQVEDRVADFTPVQPESIVYAGPTGLIATDVTQTTMKISWDALPALVAEEYVLFVDGVARSGTNLLYADLSGLTAGTKYAFSVQAKVDGVLTRMSDTIIQVTLA